MRKKRRYNYSSHKDKYYYTNKDQSLADQLRSLLHQIFPEAKDASSNTQVRINCPFCEMEGDPDKGLHMYINLGLNNKPPMYNCFRRGHSGLLTKQLLEQFCEGGLCIDPHFLNKFENETKSAYNFRAYSLIKNEILPISIPLVEKVPYFEKIRYIQNRIGINLSYDECTKNKIILNFWDFLKSNYLDLTMNEHIINLLNQCFVGFLTNSNATIIFRNILSKEEMESQNNLLKMRYMKYNVVVENVPTSYYLIPTQCDIFKHIDIVIAEGPFDILSIFYNLWGGNRSNVIYASIGSKAYVNLIKYFFEMYGLTNVTFHIYIDNGIEQDILNKIKAMLNPIDIDVYIHMNTYPQEKDFGVPLNRISDYCYKL